MPGESLHKDLAEVIEFYAEDKRLGLPSREVAWYLVHSLQLLATALRALPSDVPDENPKKADAGE